MTNRNRRLAELERRAAERAEAGSAIQKVLAASVPAEVMPRFVEVAKRALAREPISEEELAFLRPYQRRLRAGLAAVLAGR